MTRIDYKDYLNNEKRSQKKKRNIPFLKLFFIALFVTILIAISPLFKVIWAITYTHFFEKPVHVNILFLGVDSVDHSSRSDTIIVVGISPDKKVALLSIPRDTRVEVPGKGYTKINHAYAYGGISLLKETIEKFMGIKIDYYVKTDYQGFEKVIDKLGGIEINVEKRMYYIDKAGHLYIDLKPGKQVLDGKKAIQYVRFRHDKLGDIGRIKRQQKFLNALAQKLMKSGNVFRSPSIIKDIFNALDTNLDIKNSISLVNMLTGIKREDIIFLMLPGEPKYINGISYWLPDMDKIKQIVNEYFIPNGDKGTPKVNNTQNPEIKLKWNNIKIEILNGNGAPGMAAKVSKSLREKGITNIAKIGNAGSFTYNKTEILYRKGFKIYAQEIAKILGVGICKEEEREGVDITIIVGADYLKL